MPTNTFYRGDAEAQGSCYVCLCSMFTYVVCIFFQHTGRHRIQYWGQSSKRESKSAILR